MNKIINGKKYNTETAEMVASNSNNLPANDFNYHCTELYRKKTGEFFILKSSCFESLTRPVSEESAKSWCEEHLTGDEYEAIFGEVEE